MSAILTHNPGVGFFIRVLEGDFLLYYYYYYF